MASKDQYSVITTEEEKDVKDQEVQKKKKKNQKKNGEATYKYPWILVKTKTKKNDLKVQHMYKKWSDIEANLTESEHYFKRWSRLDNCTRCLFRAIVVFSLIATVVVSIVAGATSMPWLSYVAAGLAGFAGLQETLVELCITDFTTRKRTKYLDECRIRRNYLDQMFVKFLDSTEKPSKGGTKIHNEELKQYLKLSSKMDEELIQSSLEHQSILAHFVQSQFSKSDGDITGGSVKSPGEEDTPGTDNSESEDENELQQTETT